MRSWRKVAAIIGTLTFLPVQGLAAEWTLARLSFSSGWDALPAVVAIERGFFIQEKLMVSGLSVSSAA